MMNIEDLNSSIDLKLKNKNKELLSFNGQSKKKFFDYQLKKFIYSGQFLSIK